MEALIVGAGAMGRWFASVIDATVAFADVDDAAGRDAVAEIGGRTVPIDTDERFDVVCIAVPMTVATDAIGEHAERATEAIVDLTGVMTGPIEAMAAAGPALERASLHPLFAPENAPGRIATVVDAEGPVVGSILRTLEAEGNTVVRTTPEEHDRAMRTVQARAHAAILAFALAAEPVAPEFGTPVFDALEELVAEVTNGTPRVYADIQDAFDGAEDVADAARRLASADSEEFERLYRSAGK